MTTRHKRTLKQAVQWHRQLAWGAGLLLCLFILSAMTHPLLTWTGPQPDKMRPPSLTVSSESLPSLMRVLQKHNIDRAAFVKLVASENGPVLQVTEDQLSARRYFDPKSLNELIDYESQHAVWLARHYTGKQTAAVRSMVFQTQFSDAYPSVNRLLPVYQVTFDDDSNLSAFVYTELNALAGLSNPWRTRLQFVFKNVHTLSWLNGFDHARVIIMALMCLCIIGLVACGIGLLWLLKHRRIASSSRRVHRCVAYLVCIPLLGFSVSGLFHLLHSAYAVQEGTLHVKEMTGLSTVGVSQRANLKVDDVALNNASLFETSDGRLLYRLSVAKQGTGAPVTKEQRFKGMSKERGARYIDAVTGQEAAMDDQQVAQDVLTKLGVLGEVTQAKRVTHFGPEYDFRNKRLPVWALTLETGNTVFVDVATGIIVDQVNALARAEGWSFSMLHKWNFLRPLMGRKSRDVALVFTLLLSLSLVVTGYVMLARRRRQT